MYAIYLRKSRADEELELYKGDTLERHRKTLLDLAARQGLTVSHVYEEVVSGDSIVARPQMQLLLSDVEKGLYKGVLVMEVERLARGDTMDQGLVAQTFKYSDTLIITPLKTYNPNNESDEEYFEFGLFMSRREYTTTRRRLLRGREASAREGKFVGSIAPYGYERQKLPHDKGYTLKIVPEKAEVIKLIFDLYVNGELDEFGHTRRLGIDLIAKKLNQMGIPPHRNDYWQKEVIRDILDNPVYAGYIRWGYRKTTKKMEGGKLIQSKPAPTGLNDYIFVKGLHEPIITTELYEQVRELAKNRPIMPVGYKKEIKSPISGLVICRKCGRKMSFRASTTPGKPDYLVCKARGCNNVSTPLHIVERAILNAIKKWVIDYEFTWEQKRLNPQDKVEPLIDAKAEQEKELATLNKQMNTAHDLLEQGVYTVTQFANRTRTLNGKIAEVQEDIRRIEQELLKADTETAIIEEFVPKVKSIIEGYDTLQTPAEKNKILKEIVEKVIYNKERSGAYKGVSVEDFELELFVKLPCV